MPVLAAYIKSPAACYNCGGATFEKGNPVWSSSDGSNVAGFEVSGDVVLRSSSDCGRSFDYQDLDLSSAHTAADGRVELGNLLYLEIQSASVV